MIEVKWTPLSTIWNITVIADLFLWLRGPWCHDSYWPTEAGVFNLCRGFSLSLSTPPLSRSLSLTGILVTRLSLTRSVDMQAGRGRERERGSPRWLAWPLFIICFPLPLNKHRSWEQRSVRGLPFFLLSVRRRGGLKCFKIILNLKNHYRWGDSPGWLAREKYIISFVSHDTRLKIDSISIYLLKCGLLWTLRPRYPSACSVARLQKG